MKTKLPMLALTLAGVFAASPAVAQSRAYYGTVVDVNPVTTGQVERVCRNVGGYDRYNSRQDTRYTHPGNRYSNDPNRVGGAVAGAVIGGVLGNQIGDGRGQTAATVAGAVIGGLAGREIQDRHQDNRYDDRYGYRYSDRPGYTPPTGYQECWNETRPGGRVVGYDVTYRVNGRIYATRTDYRPAIGSRIRISRPW